MEKFLMICYVAADFGPYDGDMFRVTPTMIGTFIEAPVWVKDTLLFKWLIKDGSIKVAEEQITKKQGENDPMEGMAASGKDEAVAVAAEKEATEHIEEAAEGQKESPAEEEKPAAEEKPAKPARQTNKKKAKKDDAK